jgi:hypothetical protein
MLKTSRHINFYVEFCGIFNWRGQLVFFNIGFAARLVFTGMEGEIA